MRGPLREELLDELLIQVDRLWRDQADKDEVENLIRRHPEFSVEMQEFLGDLVESDGSVDAEFQKAEESVYQWLLTRGIDEALSAAARVRRHVTSHTTERSGLAGGVAGGDPSLAEGVGEPSRETWLAFLGRRAGRKKSEIAASITNATLEFLSLVSRYPHVVPDQVKSTLSVAVQERFDVPAEESLEYLSGAGIVRKRAASRREPGGGPPESFEQLLDRGALNPAAKHFWRKCAQRQD